MVPIVATVLSRTNYSTMDVPEKAKAEQKLKAYFYTAALSTRYTEGTNAKINDDYKSLRQWILSDTVPGLISRGVDWNTEKIVENNKNGAFGKAVLCMLNNNGLQDYSNKNVGVGESIDSCDLHHIFPKAEYESLYPNTINSVFNFTWLIKDTNVYIKDKKTSQYIDDIIHDIGISEVHLKTIFQNHYINDKLYNCLKEERYNDFIDGRAELFKQLFENAGVNFSEVSQDDLEVEEVDEEDIEI